MARRKDIVVDEHRHRESGIVYQVLLTPDNKFKSSVLAGTVVGGDTANEVFIKAEKLLDEVYALKFQPAMLLAKQALLSRPTWAQLSFVGLYVDRFKWAKAANGKLYKINWGQEERADRADVFYPGDYRWSGEFNPPQTINDTTYLPYDEATWQGALDLVAVIESARLRVAAFMGEPEAMQTLLQKSGGLFLPGETK